MLNLKTISITLGILAGSAGLTNSGYNLYKNFVIIPNQNVEYNQSLIEQEPLVVEIVEVHPDPNMLMSVEVTVKIFKTGDILVESGNKRNIIPFRLDKRTAMIGSLVPEAMAAEKADLDETEYEIITLRFIEKITGIDNDRQKRVRKFSDGTMETSIIDIRSNTVLETVTEKISLSEEELLKIKQSPYKKNIYLPKKPGQPKALPESGKN